MLDRSEYRRTVSGTSDIQFERSTAPIKVSGAFLRPSVSCIQSETTSEDGHCTPCSLHSLSTPRSPVNPNIGFHIGTGQGLRTQQSLPKLPAKPSWNSDVRCGPNTPSSPVRLWRPLVQKTPLLAVDPSLRDKGAVAPPASDAATLRRQVEALQTDLDSHVGNERRLLNVNRQLRERLERCLKELNAEKIEVQFNTLNNEMEQTLQLLHRLSERNAALEKEKKDVQTTLQRRVTDFESERNSLQAEKMSLQARICDISEDLRHQRVDAQNQTFPFFPVQQVETKKRRKERRRWSKENVPGDDQDGASSSVSFENRTLICVCNH